MCWYPLDVVVTELLEHLGWSSMHIVGATASLGVDLLARDPRGRMAAIQCKRRRPGTLVGSAVVRQLVGSVQIYRTDRGLIFTTTSFSPAARELGERLGVELVDGDRLGQLARQLQTA